jgi:FkbM family methyltransferase
MMNLLRRLASVPGLRAVLLRPRVRRTIASVLALRFLRVASATTAPLTFVCNDLLLARNQVRTYSLRSGPTVTLQHGRDTEAFHELYVGGEYEPPGELLSRLLDVRRIVDVGGNIGMFTHWAAERWPLAHVIAFEPAPENVHVFREWLSRSDISAELIEACAMTHDGRVSISSGTGAGTTFAEVDRLDQSDSIPGIDLFRYLDEVDLLKIDIEGGEWPILADPRLSTLDDLTIVMEYHRRGAPRLPAFEAACELLEAAGFMVGHNQPNHWGHGVLWAWKGQPRWT